MLFATATASPSSSLSSAFVPSLRCESSSCFANGSLNRLSPRGGSAVSRAVGSNCHRSGQGCRPVIRRHILRVLVPGSSELESGAEHQRDGIALILQMRYLEESPFLRPSATVSSMHVIAQVQRELGAGGPRPRPSVRHDFPSTKKPVDCCHESVRCHGLNSGQSIQSILGVNTSVRQWAATEMSR